MTRVAHVSHVTRVFELEAHLATYDDLHAGRPDADRRKLLVAASDVDEAYRIALDVAWRYHDRQVTALYLVM